MDIQTLFQLLLIGIAAGILGGFIGVGGGVIIVPALVMVLGMTQFQAQGTSLTMMLPPIGILAVMNYYKAGALSGEHIKFGMILAAAFVIGGYLGSKMALKLDPVKVKLIFGLFMIVVALRITFKAIQELNQ